jgi:hypothetical protein
LPEQDNPTPSREYSRAFETLVQEGDEDDVVGLLAYSLFKSSIRERVRIGQTVPLHLRTPTVAERDAYRGRATRILERYAEGAIAEAEPDITETARAAAKSEIITEMGMVKTTVIDRTRAWPAIGYGVAAWFISIVITVVITLAAPGWVLNLVNHVNQAERTAPK